jgi:methyl-accepting chemotaxis protein
VQRVSNIIGEITAASAEQSDGIGSINQSVVQLDQMTQQNAALVEESAAAAESLKEQAHRLIEAVSVFRLAGGQLPSAQAQPATSSSFKPSPVSAPAPALAPKVMAQKVLAKVAARPTPSAQPAKPAAPTPKPTQDAGDWETF